MRPELFDLLQDAPPARYDVHDVLAAGRRRQRRRRAGWAIAAVVAVAAAIGVPQIVARSAPKAPASPAPELTAGAPWPFQATFVGWRSGDLKVTRPASVSLNGTRGFVVREDGPLQGRLDVFAPGVDPSGGWAGAEIITADPIAGRPAFFTGPVGSDRERRLVWWYAEDGVAVITATDSMLSHDEMRRLATAFPPTPPRPMSLPFRAAWVPDGYRLIEISSVADQGMIRAHAVLALPDVVAQRIARPTGDFGRPRTGLVIDLVSMTPERDELVCDEADHSCQVGVDGKLQLTVTGPPSIPLADIRRTITLITLAGDGPGLPAVDAFPASAQVLR